MTYGCTAVAKTNHSLAAPAVMNGMNQVWRTLCSSAADTAGDAPTEDTWVYRGLSYSARQDIGRLLDSAVPEKPAEDTEETGWQWRRAITWHRALVTALVAVVIFVGGTSLAFVRPQSALAAPFRGIAEMFAQVTVVADQEEDNAQATREGCAGQGNLATALKGTVADFELFGEGTPKEVVYKTKIIDLGTEQNFGRLFFAATPMRVVDGITTVTPVTTPTNDMSGFPSATNPLFPEYLDRRYSQFNYTVSAYGNVTVDTSVATTDAFLERIRGWLAALPVEN